ncbi:MAG: L-rhamnose isomerase, partial [Thermoguttaceae bacterium]|nr:L-rhamnose isomerase [Thermoguttaceae bacterium]
MLKALLAALLDPIKDLRRMEKEGDFTYRLALMEEMKSMPLSDVWNYYCQTKDVPIGRAWIDEMRKYEESVQSKRV